MLSSGWLASYVGQSEVPALITSLLCTCYRKWKQKVYVLSQFALLFFIFKFGLRFAQPGCFAVFVVSPGEGVGGGGGGGRESHFFLAVFHPKKALH